MVKTNFSKQGKRNRAAGRRFELKVRDDLEKKGWIIAKWTNNIDLEERKLVKVKNLFRGKNIPMMLGAGFPDFIGIKANKEKTKEVIGIEVKTKGYLDKEEKEKCRIYLEKGVFSQILIARVNKEKNRINIEYENFAEKYGNN